MKDKYEMEIVEREDADYFVCELGEAQIFQSKISR